MGMGAVERFSELLDRIDGVLESYDPGELCPDKVVGEIIKEMAGQRWVLEEAIRLATEGLEEYAYNSELLRRRALARSLIVTPDGEYPELKGAEEDLRIILELDSTNLCGGYDLLDMMFTHSCMEDEEVADVAEEFASRAEDVLLKLRSLQIRALAHADKHEEAGKLYDHWIRLFPDSELLKAAKEDADSISGDK